MTLTLKAEPRLILGKKVKSLRKEDKIPAVLYGWKEKQSRSLSIDLKGFKKVWQEAGESGLVELGVGKDTKNVLIQDVQLDPVKHEPIHVDFYAVDMEKPVTANVPFVFEGEAPAQKLGGILVKVMHEVEVEALPKDLPKEIVVDISNLNTFEDRITIAGLKLLEGVKINAEPDEIVALVEEPKEEEVVEEAPSIEDVEVVGKEKEAPRLDEGEVGVPTPDASGRSVGKEAGEEKEEKK